MSESLEHIARRDFLRLGVLAGAAAVPLWGASSAPGDRSVGARVNLADMGAPQADAGTCTTVLQQAIERCAAAGGGAVVIPPGRFLSGTVQLRSRVGLELGPGAQLLRSPNPADYPVFAQGAYRSSSGRDGHRALIFAEGAEQIFLRGTGTIDGQGGAFGRNGTDPAGRPRLIMFRSCRDIAVENLRLRNAAVWMQHYQDCEHLRIRGLQVWNHANRNNDMLDLDGCRNVTVSDCIGDTDDDGITLKSTGEAACENIVISNCVISSRCNALKCGTESIGGFRNIAISNCVVKPTSATGGFYGHPEGISAISLEVVDGGVMDGIVISNIAIRGTRVPLFVRLANRGRKPHPQAPDRGVGTLRNVRVQNIVARNVGNVGCSITGLPGHLVERVTLQGVHLELRESGERQDVARTIDERPGGYPEGTMWGRLPAYGFFVRHARRVRFDDVTVIAAAGEPRPVLVTEDVQASDHLVVARS